MAEEQELTPEEKLLKVIQKGDAPAQDAGSGGSAASILGEGQDSKPISKSGDSPVKIGAVNNLLVLLAVIALCFSGYEIYRNMPKPAEVFSTAELDLSDSGETLVVASLSDTIDMFDTKRIFGKPPEPWDPGKGRPPPEAFEGWRAYARDNLEFKGLSTVVRQKPDGGSEKVLEAIVMDTKAKRMHFLRVGSKMEIKKKDVRVDKIEGKELIFVCEDESLAIGNPGKKVIQH